MGDATPAPAAKASAASIAGAGAAPGSAEGAAPAARTGDLALFGRVVREARRSWPQMALIVLIELLATPLALLTPVPLKIVVDNVLGTQPPPPVLAPLIPAGTSDTTWLLVFAGVLLIAVAAGAQLQALARTLIEAYTGERITLRFRARLFRHLQRLSFSYHDRSGTGDAVYRVHYDAPAITNITVYGVLPILGNAVMLLAMLWVTASLSPALALVAVVVVPVLAFLARVSRHSLRRRWRSVSRLEDSSMSVVQEVLSNLRVVKGFGQEEREQARYVDTAGASVSARLRVYAFDGGISLLTALTTATGTALVLVIGALQVQSGQLTLGDLVLIMGYMAQLYAPLKSLTEKVTSLQSSLNSAERAYAVLDELPEVPEHPDARPLERVVGTLAIEGLTFGYDPARPILRDAWLQVPAGARVGIEGRTGAGKSTLMSLLMRFYDPQAGRILLDGVDLRDLRVAELRDQYAIVLQEPVLFSRTIGENIAYARPDATPEQIEAAARDAHAHTFIAALPDGYDTLVGERGMTLSGGERQRISLARAFLKNAPILILDEPTSAVDVATEKLIVEAMTRLMYGRTTFMIAHRLSTLEQCDIRVRVQDGALVPVAVPTPPGPGSLASWPAAYLLAGRRPRVPA